MGKLLSESGYRLVLAWCLLLLPGLAGAVNGQELFDAEVPVSGQLAAERSAAMKTALADVLVRVTGQRELPGLPVAQELLANPERFVQQYRYFTVPDSQPPQLRLRVRFDGEAIQQALRQQGAAYWGGAERPDTLVWLAVEEQGRRYIVSARHDSAVYRQLQQAARQRGIPLLFPLMDLEDQSLVRFTDIWGGFFDRVLEASGRYSPQAVLVGRLNRSQSGNWVARWNMQVAGDMTDWTDSNSQLGNLVQVGIDTLADRLAFRLAVTSSGTPGDTVRITVEDINTLTAYARVNDYLSSLSAVREARVEQVSDSTVQYALQLNGNLQGLTRTIAIGTVLEPMVSGNPGGFRLRQ